MKNKLLKIGLGLSCVWLFILTGCDALKDIDNNIKETVKAVDNDVKNTLKGSTVHNINFNDRISGKLYVVHGWGGLTIITDNQTGREYMYYDKTVVELKPKGE